MKKITQIFLPVIVSLMLTGMPSAGLAQTTDADFQNALTQLREARQNFKDAKAAEANERAQAGQEQNQVRRQQAEQRRAEAQKKREEHRKTVLLRLIDIQIKHLNRTKERVNKMPNIDASPKTQLNAEIDKDVQKFNDEKIKVQNTTTPEELKAFAKEIRDLFRSYREVVKQIVDAIHASRQTAAAAKAEDRAAVIKAKIEELKAAGKDTSALDADLSDAKKQIRDTQEKIGRKAFREANEDLKGAYQKFHGIAEKAKGLQ